MNLKIITPDHNAEEVKNSLLSKKRKINKFLKKETIFDCLTFELQPIFSVIKIPQIRFIDFIFLYFY